MDAEILRVTMEICVFDIKSIDKGERDNISVYYITSL